MAGNDWLEATQQGRRLVVKRATHDPRVTSLVVTRILETFPSSHFRSSAYFYIRSDEFEYLRDLSSLPGHKEALK